jgi:hypothetical protein
MLPTHGRYAYSNITARPDYTWPDGRRLAVYVALNIEAFGFGVGKGAAIAPPDQAQSARATSAPTSSRCPPASSRDELKV